MAHKFTIESGIEAASPNECGVAILQKLGEGGADENFCDY